MLETKNAEKAVLEKEKQNVEQQVNELLQGKGEMDICLAALSEVNKFWAQGSAEAMVGNYLKSPELYKWLLRFASIFSIGFTKGVHVVFEKYAGDEDYCKQGK